MKSINTTRWLIFLLIALAILALLWGYGSAANTAGEISISQLAQQIEAGEVAEINVDGNGREVTISYTNPERGNATANISENSSSRRTVSILWHYP